LLFGLLIQLLAAAFCTGIILTVTAVTRASVTAAIAVAVNTTTLLLVVLAFEFAIIAL
jgi:hypothetical protein